MIGIVYLCSNLLINWECPYDKELSLPWLNNKMCSLHVEKQAVRNLLFSYAYFVVDMFVLVFYVRQWDTLSVQTMQHHVIIIVGFGFTFYYGYAQFWYGNIGMLCEISSVFLNYRSMFSKEEMNNTFPMVNQLLFVLFFTFFRIILFPYIIFQCCKTLMFVWPVLSGWRQAAGVGSTTLLFAVTLLNLFWFSLIIKGLRKLLIEKGILKGSNNNGQEEKFDIQQIDDN